MVQCLVWEKSTCQPATEPKSRNYWAHVLQTLKPRHLEAPQQEKPPQWGAGARPLESGPAHHSQSKGRAAAKTQHSQNQINRYYFKNRLITKQFLFHQLLITFIFFFFSSYKHVRIHTCMYTQETNVFIVDPYFLHILFYLLINVNAHTGTYMHIHQLKYICYTHSTRWISLHTAGKAHPSPTEHI